MLAVRADDAAEKSPWRGREARFLVAVYAAHESRAEFVLVFGKSVKVFRETPQKATRTYLT